MDSTDAPPRPHLRLVFSAERRARESAVPAPGTGSSATDGTVRSTLSMLGLLLLLQPRAPRQVPAPSTPEKPRHLRRLAHPPHHHEVHMVITSSDELWKVHDVARYLSMSPSWVYKEAEAGRLPCVRIGAALRFSSLAIKHYLASLHEERPGATRA